MFLKKLSPTKTKKKQAPFTETCFFITLKTRAFMIV